jgi:hypothetical protein
MRVPEELLYDVPSMPSQAAGGVAWPGWAERVGRTLGDGPSIGIGIGMAALATWLVAGSMPGPKLARVTVAQPHSASRAYVATAGAVQPTVTAELGLALQQGGATPASPGDHPLAKPTQGTVKSVSATAPDVLTAAPPSRATALSRSSAATTPAPAPAAPTTPAPTTLLPVTPPPPHAAPNRTSTTPAGANHAAAAAPAPRATQRRAQQSSGQTNPGLLGGLLQVLGL